MKHLINSYEQVWSKGLNFQDTVERYEFTIQSLLHGICYVLVGIVCSLIPLLDSKWIYYITDFLFLVPFISLCVRRLNDLEKGIFYIFLLLVPIVNLFFWFYLMRQQGHGLIEEENIAMLIGLVCGFLGVIVIYGIVITLK
jgi:uncharacterized membrane protein YhaH (DUF805 family)